MVAAALERQRKGHRRGTAVSDLDWLRGLKNWSSLTARSERVTGDPEGRREQDNLPAFVVFLVLVRLWDLGRILGLKPSLFLDRWH